MGFRQGDLHARSASKNSSTIFVNVSSTKPEQIKLVEQCFSSYGHIWKSKPDRKDAVCIRCSLNRTFDFLLSKKDLIESWILENTNYFAAFLAGYTDAEGTFCLCGGNAIFSIRSQDKNILYQIRSKLIELGIFLRPSQIVRKQGTRDVRGTISNKNIFGIWIHRKDSLLKLIDLLNPYLKHSDKRKRIEILKNNIFWRNKKYNRSQSSKWDKLYSEEGTKI
ncbi:MAG: LAGLIDADG family homing endonuclease [Patescibacteria group bacterium]|nr:LAGLIDADG family homing endonuclease [Patescibacteria group bacterium]